MEEVIAVRPDYTLAYRYAAHCVLADGTSRSRFVGQPYDLFPGRGNGCPVVEVSSVKYVSYC